MYQYLVLLILILAWVGIVAYAAYRNDGMAYIDITFGGERKLRLHVVATPFFTEDIEVEVDDSVE